MIKLYSLILLFSISFTQNLIEDDITSFIESLDDKTLRLTIQKDNIDLMKIVLMAILKM